MLTCHYDVLGIDQSASFDDIKRAYKRLALIFHPDKNNSSKESTEKFAQIQAAYEILSDEVERKWYDEHREQILWAGHKTSSNEKFVPVTSVEELMVFFDPNIFKKMDDSNKGFYTRIRELFERLASEELAFAKQPNTNMKKMPSFGNSKSPYEPDVKEFYKKWSYFSTEKSFSWVDQYKYSNSERKAKRVMEKENNRLRKIAIKEFNDTVKSLVSFIKKRDVRVKFEKISEADRQACLLASSKAQAEKDRATFQASLGVYDEQEWAKIETKIEDNYEEESEDEEIFECVACKKIFKSERQYIVHEKSKKHIKSVNILKNILRKEFSEQYAENSYETFELFNNVDEHFIEEKNIENYQEKNSDILKKTPASQEDCTVINNCTSSQHPSDKSDLYDTKIDSENSAFLTLTQDHDSSEDCIDFLSDALNRDLLGKKNKNDTAIKNKCSKNSKKKKEKKTKDTNINNNTTCMFCLEKFPSRNKLFDHFRYSGHAQPLSQLKRKK
ncbi:hypothetical protein PORY_001604 [Pneumocystis oryctolagi]|uniref:Uncharacterized protein n=1 Tax=Pneumocystis oryctolagi TaxID=42067 RepID=A0ACB7CB28_9ASCO|nr:hypothetical protein PORY_001604 [Pneumocystis oryctolagi]